MTAIIPKYTVCVCVDAKTLTQLMISHVSWKHHHPELFRVPWLVMYDIASLDYSVVRSAMHTIQPQAAISAWTPSGSKVAYETQRERMVTAHVFAAYYVQTEYMLKIDTDAVCVKRKIWPKHEWFEDDPVCVASPWGYTKAKGGGGSIEQWASRLESWGDTFSGRPRLGLADRIKPGGNKFFMPRHCSWLAFYRTDAAKAICRCAEAVCGDLKLPVPSEDTTRWYYIERMGLHMHRANMKRHGWTNCSSMDSLKETTRNACD